MNCTTWLSHIVKIGLVVTMMSPLVELVTDPASAQGIQMWNTPCLKAYKTWKSLAKHKAFVVSNSSAGGGEDSPVPIRMGHQQKLLPKTPPSSPVRKRNMALVDVM